MIQFRIFVFICCITVSSFEVISAEVPGLSSEADSIIVFLDSGGRPDAGKIDLLLETAWELKSSNTAQALKYAQRGLDFAEKHNLQPQMAYALKVMGVLYWQSGNFTNAMNYQMESHALYEDLEDPEGMGSTLSNLGLIFSDQGHYEKALEYLLEALDIHEQHNSPYYVAPVLNNIGLVYQNQGQYLLAEEYHLKSLKIKKEIDDLPGIAFTLSNLGFISKMTRNYELALEYYKRALDIRHELNQARELAITYNDLGHVYSLIDSLSLADDFLRNSLRLFQQVEDQSGLALCYNHLGMVQMAMGNFTQSRRLFNKSLEMSRQMGLVKIEMDNYHSLADLLSRQGAYELAYQYQDNYMKLLDSIYSHDNKRKIIEIQLLYEREKKEKEIELLKKSNEINSLSFEKQVMHRNFLLAGIILVLALLFLLYNRYLSINNTNKKLELQKEKISETNQKLFLLNRDLMKEKQKVEELNERLKDANQKLLESERHLINTNRTKDKFFSIISHDLRNPFASIVSFSRILKREINDMSREELQELALELDKSVLKINNLLENLLQWSRAQTGKIKFNPEYFEVNEIVDENLNLFIGNAREKDIDIIDELEEDLIVYGDMNMTNTIVRNLLSNALKYTRPGGTIKLGSESISGMAYFSVADNGVGISAENIKKLFRVDTLHTTFGTKDEKGSGLGLLLIKEFVEKQGGHISLESKEGEGTTVTFSLPLQAPEENKENS